MKSNNQIRESYKQLTELLNFRSIDWKLLLFLLLVLNVKLVIKVIAIVCLLILDRRAFSISDFKKNTYLWFYIILIAIATVNFFINKGYTSTSYIFLFGLGISYWLLMAGAAWYLFNRVRTVAYNNTINTITVFLLLNAFISFGQLFLIMIETGSINPYTYQGFYQKYFINTGDFIKGISFDTSTTNALINAFGIFFFLYNRNYLLVLICTIALLLTGSNVTNLLTLGTLIFTFIFYSDRLQKSIICIALTLFVIFMSKISPQNSEYLLNNIAGMFNKTPANKNISANVTDIRLKPDSLLSPEEHKIKTATIYMDSISLKVVPKSDKSKLNSKSASKTREVVIPTKNKFTPFYERKQDSTEKQKQFAELTVKNTDSTANAKKIELTTEQLTGPGKVAAGKLLFTYLKHNPQKIVFGSGLGNFSSKLAFKASGESSIAGGYITKYKYLHSDFKNYHFKLYSTYFAKDEGEHSVINTPNSVYFQLLGEYGIAGIVAFFILYIFYFLRRLKKRNFGLPILLLLSGALLFDYWFEHLSIIILFELLLLTDIFHKQQQKTENEIYEK